MHHSTNIFDNPYEHVTPICVEGMYQYVLQQPDGKLFAPDVQDFDSEIEALDYLRELREADDRRREAIAAEARAKKTTQ